MAESQRPNYSPYPGDKIKARLEEGEVVMNRNAVQSVGLETMNRLNQSGSGGAVNISFSGNVMSDDFIESEAIPKIKEALRRGGDIGV